METQQKYADRKLEDDRAALQTQFQQAKHELRRNFNKAHNPNTSPYPNPNPNPNLNPNPIPNPNPNPNLTLTLALTLTNPMDLFSN